MKVKLTDLKIGDKVKYTCKDIDGTNITDIGILTRIENNKYWFKWENESVEMYLSNCPTNNLELISIKFAFTDKELI